MQGWVQIGLYIEAADTDSKLDIFKKAIDHRDDNDAFRLYRLRNALIYLLERELSLRGHMPETHVTTSFYWFQGLRERAVGRDHYIDGDYILGEAIDLWRINESSDGPFEFSRRQKYYVACAMRRVLKLLDYKPGGVEDYLWLSAIAYIHLCSKQRFFKENVEQVASQYGFDGLTLELGNRAVQAMRKTGLISNAELAEMLS